MNVYNAIMAAADHIERNPHLFDFGYCAVPDCGTPGCALGLIGLFANVGIGADVGMAVSNDILGHSDFGRTFYARMDALTSREWADDPALCAITLRLYAAKYHAPPLPYVDLPAIVREIFNERVTS